MVPMRFKKLEHLVFYAQKIIFSRYVRRFHQIFQVQSLFICCIF